MKHLKLFENFNEIDLDYILSDNDRILDYAEEHLNIDNFSKDDDIFIDNSYDI